MVLNKRQMILCKTPLEAMNLMDYLTYLGYLQRLPPYVVTDLPSDGKWEEYKEKSVYMIHPSPSHGSVELVSIDYVVNKNEVINFSDIF